MGILHSVFFYLHSTFLVTLSTVIRYTYILKKIKYIINMATNEFIRGTIKTLVLKLLSEKKKMYGYEISAKVKELSKDEIQLTYGALYPILYKLESEGMLSTQSELVDNRARKYYSLTKKGNEVAKVKVNELQQFMDTMKVILSAPKASFESWAY